MCTTQVAANFPVAPQCGPGLGVALGWRRWKPAGAVIPPGSGARGCAGLFWRKLWPGRCSSCFPRTTKRLVCPEGSGLQARRVEAPAPKGSMRRFQRKPMGLGQFPAGTEGCSRYWERMVSEARRAASGGWPGTCPPTPSGAYL